MTLDIEIQFKFPSRELPDDNTPTKTKVVPQLFKMIPLKIKK